MISQSIVETAVEMPTAVAAARTVIPDDRNWTGS
jgi:hypothetical protein